MPEAMVRDWAEDILAEWFPGYTDFVPAVGAQCRIQHEGDGVFTVTPQKRGAPISRFKINISVQEIR